MSEPKVFKDFEFGCKNGQLINVTIDGSTDSATWTNERIDIYRKLEDEAYENMIVYRDERGAPIAYERCVTRTVKPEPKDPLEAAIAGVPV